MVSWAHSTLLSLRVLIFSQAFALQSIMISPSLLSLSMWALCTLPSQASWFRRSNAHLVRAASGEQSPGDTSHDTQQWAPSHTDSLFEPHSITTTLTSQNMPVTSMVAAYEVCNTPESNTSSCSTVFQNITTSWCSTVLTACKYEFISVYSSFWHTWEYKIIRNPRN